MDTKDRLIVDQAKEIAKLKKNSSNSSQPPSSDIVKPPKNKDRRRKKKIGAQKGLYEKVKEKSPICTRLQHSGLATSPKKCLFQGIWTDHRIKIRLIR
jgi:hypothetical protein